MNDNTGCLLFPTQFVFKIKIMVFFPLYCAGPHLISFRPQARNVPLQESMTVTDGQFYCHLICKLLFLPNTFFPSCICRVYLGDSLFQCLNKIFITQPKKKKKKNKKQESITFLGTALWTALFVWLILPGNLGRVVYIEVHAYCLERFFMVNTRAYCFHPFQQLVLKCSSTSILL